MPLGYSTFQFRLTALFKEMIEIRRHGETCPMDSDGSGILFEDPDMFYMLRYRNV